MFLLKSQLHRPCGRPNLTYCVFKETFRKVSGTPHLFAMPSSKENNRLENLIIKYESKIFYNSTIEGKRIKLGYKKNNEHMQKVERFNEKMRKTLASIQPLPISLKYLSEDRIKEIEEEPLNNNHNTETDAPEQITQFPYSDNSYSVKEQEQNLEKVDPNKDITNTIDREIRRRHELLKDMKNWMTSYDNFEHDLVDRSEGEDDNWQINYGTPDPNSNISNVPCGGCGALLHCKDTAIPGYIPSEIFQNNSKKGAANLEAIICQRCYFLKEFNLSLQVRVSSDDYPKILTSICDKNALVVLMVDLMDFPCSIWPGIADILGPNTPIMVVGNKIDLLPKDDDKYLNRIKQILLDYIKLSGFGNCNILHTSLISAKTGYGIEDFITSLYSKWKYNGDVYLVGCTNVGKSSLFNALLQSDYCKIQASDLIQRATISRWPGTTLNLLKFPITRPSGYRLYLRHHRMQALTKVSAEERRARSEQVKKINTATNATLIGHIGQTYKMTDDVDEKDDPFSTQGHTNASGKVKMGINEKHPDYALSRWCFDTPGVVHADQILHLLTTEELVYTLPKQLIRPETFCVRVGTSLFIAGLARLDYLDGPGSIRLTVFRSNELPITICPIEEAETIYKECIGTKLFKVPVDNADRLSKWPGLEDAKPFTITGTGWKTSCNDVVLSSAGWVAINCAYDKTYKFQAWTPEKRGIYIRDCILPHAVTLRGPRIRFSPAYKAHKFI